MNKLKTSAQKFLRSKILWSLIVLALIVRIMAPPLILKKLNQYLADFSPI